MTHPYIRAAAKHPGLKAQARERLDKRKGKPDTPPGKPDKPLKANGKPD
jgi:hypothetical protein